MNLALRSRPHTVFPLFVGAALLAFSLQAKDDTSLGLLSKELPRGTALENASCPETVFATRQAVRKHPDQAVPILKSAINSRMSAGDQPTRPGVKSTRDPKDGVMISCECVTRIVQAALQAAPNNKAHDIIETAMAMQPQCGEEFAGLLKKPGIDFKDGPAAADNGNGSRNGGRSGDNGVNGDGFGGNLLGGDPSLGASGTGFGGFGDGGSGSGFPGSPGFIGSAPGGAGSVFPTVNVPPVTSVVNQ